MPGGPAQPVAAQTLPASSLTPLTPGAEDEGPKKDLTPGLAATAPVTQSLAVQAGGFDRTLHPQAQILVEFFIPKGATAAACTGRGPGHGSKKDKSE